jgi:opacity protein-like surface antigen
MKQIYLLFFGFTFLFLSGNVYSQDLDVLLNAETKPTVNYTTATFKASRIINGHSIEQMKKSQLDFRISHRFGTLNEGAYGLWGLDNSNIHFSLEYGVTNWLMLGVGRGSLNKVYDGFAKFKILRQSTGAKTMPVSMSYFTSMEITTLHFEDPTVTNYFSSRLAFVNQLLIARKFNDKFSFQLTPSWVHRNLVPTELDQNDIIAIGAGARYKLTKRMSVNAEYYYKIEPNAKYLEPRTYNSASIGIDLETGGHVFQIMLSNSIGMREGMFIPETTDSWKDGGIHLGFNISRVFTL